MFPEEIREKRQEIPVCVHMHIVLIFKYGGDGRSYKKGECLSVT